VNEERSEAAISTTTTSAEKSEVTETSESNESSISPKDDITVEEQVLLDHEGILITLQSLNADNIFGPSLKVLVENNGSKDVIVQTRNSVINGVMIESMFSCDVVAGKKANNEITFMSSDLKTAQIETIKDIEFSFHIADPESFTEIYSSDTINITTSADESFVQSYDDSGFVALDQNDFKVVVKKLDSEDSFWGADIYLYVENNSDKNAIMQVRDVSINGFMVEPMFSCDILSGKKAFDSITFLESDLKDNNIESINDLEFYFTIVESDGWNKIFDSDLLKVSFSD
ncbi:MAG: hypothetical protein IMZ52_01355, partial [Actinobacteria bacterium]|nr:hypothetical protein [Actinomycetota bacterium]